MVEQNELFGFRPQHPGKHLRRLLDEKGWTQDDLAAITGRRRQTISDMISGRSGTVTLEMARVLAAAFGNTPQEWLRWDSAYRLSVAESDMSDVEQRAKLYDSIPIRDMQRRGWIKLTTDAKELEVELTRFFGQNPLHEGVVLSVAARRLVVSSELNQAEVAWCYRAKQIASSVMVEPFSPSNLPKAEKKLRALAAYPKESRRVSRVLGEFGIRFVIVEPLPGSKIDGAAIWIGDEPVIALSIKDDRIDGFWFTLMHEFSHIRNGDASADNNLIDGVNGIVVKLVEQDAERIANEQAANSLVPTMEMNSFIRRVGPFYSRERIIQFANRMQIHPGIIVGQLQHRGEIGYSASRDFLVKVRDTVTSTALTDGWNQILGPGIA